jgi:hypothetical protein
MARKIILLLCLSMGVGFLYQGNSDAGDPIEETLELESGLYYTILKGDTLWDLSEHFYDSPWIWPDLWEKNQQIANPHWIYPGEQIRLFSREELETMVRPETEAGAEVAVQPPESPYYLYSAINSVGFIRKKPVSPSGIIFKVKEDKEIVGERDVVYIRPMGKTTFQPGDRFTVFRTFKPLKDKDTKALIGVQHYLVGILEVTDVQPEFAIATIVRSFRHIELNDLLMPYEAQSPKIMLAESKEGLKGKIIVAEEHQDIFADTVVFIDKGRQNDIKVGQSYSVYYQEKEYLDPDEKESILLSPVDFGKILVLRTEETTATALVTMAQKAIEPGATIRTPCH